MFFKKSHFGKERTVFLPAEKADGRVRIRENAFASAHMASARLQAARTRCAAARLFERPEKEEAAAALFAVVRLEDRRKAARASVRSSAVGQDVSSVRAYRYCAAEQDVSSVRAARFSAVAGQRGAPSSFAEKEEKSIVSRQAEESRAFSSEQSKVRGGAEDLRRREDLYRREDASWFTGKELARQERSEEGEECVDLLDELIAGLRDVRGLRVRGSEGED